LMSKNLQVFDKHAVKWREIRKHQHAVMFLIDNKFNIICDDSLFWNAKLGNEKIVKYLVENGADVHAHDDRALRTSVFNKHINVAKYLISVGANVCANNNEALIFCVRHNYVEMGPILIENGAILPEFVDYYFSSKN